MDIHEQYNAMMADVERVKQMKADINTYPIVSDDGNGKIVLDLSQNKYNGLKLNRYMLDNGMWE